MMLEFALVNNDIGSSKLVEIIYVNGSSRLSIIVRPLSFSAAVSFKSIVFVEVIYNKNYINKSLDFRQDVMIYFLNKRKLNMTRVK